MLFLLACRPEPPDTTQDSGADSAEEIGLDSADIAEPSGACGLVSDLASANFLEGDAVAFTVQCTGTLATESASFAATNLPTGSSFDAAARTFSWTTGPADGGRFDVHFVVSPADGSNADEGTVTFWVADDPSNPNNMPVVPAEYTEEWGLPVVHVQTDAELNIDAYADATVSWYGGEYPAGIQVHGKTSTQYPKKSYALKFTGAELPIAEWGVSRDHLLLITTFDDNSYVRQKLTYDLWAAMAAYWGQPRLAPRALFAVVYLNGSYLGLYTAEDRIDDEFADQQGFSRSGNIYKAVDDDANFGPTDAEGAAKSAYHQGYDKMEGEPVDDFSDLDALVEFTANSTASELISGSPSWVDLNEWLDALTLLQYVNGEDSYLKNIYLYHDADGVFRYAPWDFNASWGQNWRTYRVSPEFIDGDASQNRIFWAILEDSAANGWMTSRCSQLRTLGPLHPAWATARLDEYFAKIDPSAQRDWDKWSGEYHAYGNWAEHREENADWTDYVGEKAYMYQWVADRAVFYQSEYP